MAQYERKFLIPYLRNVCSVEMFKRYLDKEIAKCKTQINNLNNDIWSFNQKRIPEKPVRENYKRNFKWVTIWGSIVITTIVLFFIKEDDWMVAMGTIDGLLDGIMQMLAGCTLFVSFFCFFVALFKSSKIKYYKHDLERWEEEITEYNNKFNLCKQYNKQVQVLWKNLNDLEKQERESSNVLKQLYDINIIPRRYRNVHAAYYLYDYFDTTERENDLDKVIQTMLLDNIVQQLEQVINQVEMIIMNQRYEIALQETQNEIIQKNHKEQMRLLARMEKDIQLQTDYLDMIEANTRANNLFVLASFWGTK